MAVAEDKRGPYVQVAYLLRMNKDGGGPHRELRRRAEHIAAKRWRYTDDPDTDPTLITFEADDSVDVDALLQQGAIRPYTPPKPARPARGERGESKAVTSG